MSRTAFVGDQMTHGGQKGFGMTKHGRSGHATRSPRFRFLQKLRRMIARTALGSKIRNGPSKSYSIPGSRHEPGYPWMNSGVGIRKFGACAQYASVRRATIRDTLSLAPARNAFAA